MKIKSGVAGIDAALFGVCGVWAPSRELPVSQFPEEGRREAAARHSEHEAAYNAGLEPARDSAADAGQSYILPPIVLGIEGNACKPAFSC